MGNIWEERWHPTAGRMGHTAGVESNVMHNLALGKSDAFLVVPMGPVFVTREQSSSARCEDLQAAMKNYRAAMRSLSSLG